MNITIIGASAGIGLETVKRALERKHQVKSLSRSSINFTHPNLNPIYGDALNKTVLLRSIRGADAVIVTLGTGKSMKATTLFSDFAKLLVEIHQEYKFETPFIFITGFGAGESYNYVPWYVKMFLNCFLKDVYEDKAKFETIISNSKMNWMIHRPGRLLNNTLTEKYRIESELYKGINIGDINRSDVADFLVKQSENPIFIHKYTAISLK